MQYLVGFASTILRASGFTEIVVSDPLVAITVSVVTGELSVGCVGVVALTEFESGELDTQPQNNMAITNIIGRKGLFFMIDYIKNGLINFLKDERGVTGGHGLMTDDPPTPRQRTLRETTFQRETRVTARAIVGGHVCYPPPAKSGATPLSQAKFAFVIVLFYDGMLCWQKGTEVSGGSWGWGS